MRSGSAADAPLPLFIAFVSSLAEEIRCLELDLGIALPRAPAEVPRMVLSSLRCAHGSRARGTKMVETALF